MAYVYATLGGNNLPVQFSYRPPTPRKRYLVVKTGGAIRIHKAPAIVHGDQTIEWSIQAALRSEFSTLLDLYNDADAPDLAFVGYWGDQHTVRLLEPMVVDRVYSGGLFDLSGSFQIVSTTSWGSA